MRQLFHLSLFIHCTHCLVANLLRLLFTLILKYNGLLFFTMMRPRYVSEAEIPSGITQAVHSPLWGVFITTSSWAARWTCSFVICQRAAVRTCILKMSTYSTSQELFIWLEYFCSIRVAAISRNDTVHRRLPTSTDACFIILWSGPRILGWIILAAPLNPGGLCRIG